MHRLLIAVVALLVVGITAAEYTGIWLSAPSPSVVGPQPADLLVESVVVDGKDETALKGWFVAGEPGRGVVLLLHGLRADRRQMIGRARFLHRAGYSVLLIDFQAHGESPGNHMTFGYLESRNAIAVVQYLRKRLPEERLGVIGFSLGGAAALLGEQPLPAEAIVLEAVYSTFEQAVKNRLRIKLGYLGQFLAPLLLGQVQTRLGFKPDELVPVKRISDALAPIFIIAGGKDRKTTIDDTYALFHNAPEPKRLWILQQAHHQDFHQYAPQEYERKVLRFFEWHLRSIN